jgi:acetyl esterase
MRATTLLPALRAKVETPLVRMVLGLPPSLRRPLNGRATRVDGLVLDPDMQTLLRLDQLVGEPDLPKQPLEQARAAMTRHARIVGGDQPIGTLRTVTSPDPAAGSRCGCTGLAR